MILQLHAPESAGRKLRLPSCSSSYWGKQANRVQVDSDPSVEWISPLSAKQCTRRRIFNSLLLPVSMIWPAEARVNSPWMTRKWFLGLIALLTKNLLIKNGQSMVAADQLLSAWITSTSHSDFQVAFDECCLYCLPAYRQLWFYRIPKPIVKKPSTTYLHPFSLVATAEFGHTVSDPASGTVDKWKDLRHSGCTFLELDWVKVVYIHHLQPKVRLCWGLTCKCSEWHGGPRNLGASTLLFLIAENLSRTSSWSCKIGSDSIHDQSLPNNLSLKYSETYDETKNIYNMICWLSSLSWWTSWQVRFRRVNVSMCIGAFPLSNKTSWAAGNILKLRKRYIWLKK